MRNSSTSSKSMRLKLGITSVYDMWELTLVGAINETVHGEFAAKDGGPRTLAQGLNWYTHQISGSVQEG